MSKIFEYTFSYKLARNYMVYCFRQFYGEYIVTGKENLPTDNSALIFAPNHLNALMDALAVSSLMPRRKAVIYLARADFFQNRTIARIMHFAKIMPAFRMRDGFENLGKNNRIFLDCIDVLRFGHSICIMPEGGQGEEQKIRPLVKGIFRLAFEAQKEFGDSKKVKIVPLGIHFGDLEKCGKPIIINIGKPIEIDDYIQKFETNAPVAINKVKKALHDQLSDLTLDLATSQYYDCFQTVTDIMAEEFIESEEKQNITNVKFLLKQKTAKTLVEIEKTDPALMSELNRLSVNYKSLLRKLSFKSSIFSQVKSDETSLSRFISLMITFPVFFFGLITNVLPTFIPVWIRKLSVIGYSGFYSSAQFGLGILLFPLFYLSQAIIFHATLSPNWGITIIFSLLQFFTRSFSLKWYSNLVKYLHKVRFNGLLVARLEQSSTLYKLIDLRNRIVYRINTKNRENH